MSKFLMVGMPLSQVMECATVNPSRIFSLNDRGTLKVGAPADVAILELREGTFEFLGNYNNTRAGKQRLFPSGTVLALLSRPGQLPELLGRFRGNETAANQSMREQFGQPFGIAHV